MVSLPEINRQNCPICKQYVKASSRYPNYVCRKCTEIAIDDNGEHVYFFNTELSGHGCAGAYTKTDKPYNSSFCYIKGFKCKAEEGYFGGIVILPNFVTKIR